MSRLSGKGHERGLRTLAVMLLLAAVLYHPRDEKTAASFRERTDDGRLELLIDVNSAGIEELASLPGVGPALAAGIIDQRCRTGFFRHPADLLAVKGIGPAKLSGLEGWMTLTGRTSVSGCD